ncbi:peptide chain release factor N(5)-glutamine methyltransferase [Aphanothece hegewaldii CCALA 016]|uniref:Release factor glutamine methyltransferase n=1 Tax=Aphanothece hegewaldii CCALA 016 TaxID=2107694 RepID=A0A2T1LYH1_9CHRO|nr:peptide chain release factor N(5)-glutamine methyltransferase [Aphanothece hegewaldii]PSF37448.1 peptide chain release factor N(5)-glutamine methyltransferase [Aphanothece hegewaldii CCALA 016]
MSFSCSGKDLSLWREQAKQQAIAASISVKEVDWLLIEVTDLDSLALRLESFKQRSQIFLKYDLDQLTQLWRKRTQNRIPLQYLIGQTHWRSYLLNVSPAVLIPRPETELIIDNALKAVQNSSLDLSTGIWVDLGTGSGAIAIALAESLTKAKIYATDTSSEAIAIAQENINRLGFAERIQLLQGSWWTPLEAFKGEGLSPPPACGACTPRQISGMISNPPYIPSQIIPTLQPEVAAYEPKIALDGGEDGLDAIRYLVQSAPDYLHSGGIWLIEMMAGQGEQVMRLLEEQGNYCNIQIINDLAGFDRFVLAYRR